MQKEFKKNFIRTSELLRVLSPYLKYEGEPYGLT